MADWNQTVAGPWLAETLAALRRPEVFSRIDPGNSFRAGCGPIRRQLVRLELYRTPENPTVETDSVAGHIGFELRCEK